MKITQKHLRVLSGILILLGAIIAVLTRNYNAGNPDDPNHYGQWLGIGLMIAGLVLLAPWVKDQK
jgi:drug/metabolite transporter (DMT)-like permease